MKKDNISEFSKIIAKPVKNIYRVTPKSKDINNTSYYARNFFRNTNIIKHFHWGIVISVMQIKYRYKLVVSKLAH